MQVDDVISGREGLAGVEWLLRGRRPRAVLRRLLRTMLERPEALRGCSLTRAKFRANHKLTATFDACLRDPCRPFERIRPMTVVWSSDGRHASRSSANANGLAAEASRRGASAPFRELAAEVPGWNMRVQVAPLDERFPQLIRLSDPAYAREVLGGPSALPQVHWVRYRPGERHLLRYEVSEEDGGARMSFVKIYSGESEARRAYLDTARISDWLAAQDARISSVPPLAGLDRDMAVLFPRAPGSPMSAYLQRPYPGLAGLLEQAGAALRLLQGAPVSLAGDRGRWDAGMQVAAALRTGENRLSLLPSASASFRRLMDRAQEVEARLCREPDLFSHGDFKSDHLYVTARGLTLIDFDNRYLAEPGYDAGKFLADLHWWLSAYGAACVEQAQTHFLAGYGAEPGRLSRVRLWEALMLASLGVRRALPSDGDWAARLAWMFSRADHALKRLEKECV